MGRTKITGRLTEADHAWYAQRIVELLRDKNPRLGQVRERLVKDLLRRWTTDGVRDGGVVVESAWTSFELLPSTAAAREAFRAHKAKDRPGGAQERRRRGFTHDHVVPCAFLLRWLKGLKKPQDADVLGHLRRLCRGALISTSEDACFGRCKPSLKDDMPQGWSVSLRSNPWERYEKTFLKDGRNLFAALEFPADYPDPPPGARIRRAAAGEGSAGP